MHKNCMINCGLMDIPKDFLFNTKKDIVPASKQNYYACNEYSTNRVFLIPLHIHAEIFHFFGNFLHFFILFFLCISNANVMSLSSEYFVKNTSYKLKQKNWDKTVTIIIKMSWFKSQCHQKNVNNDQILNWFFPVKGKV